MGIRRDVVSIGIIGVIVAWIWSGWIRKYDEKSNWLFIKSKVNARRRAHGHRKFERLIFQNARS